jgi:hypothetical protein
MGIGNTCSWGYPWRMLCHPHLFHLPQAITTILGRIYVVPAGVDGHYSANAIVYIQRVLCKRRRYSLSNTTLE